MSTGERLKLAREALDLSQEEIASGAGIAVADLESFEGDTEAPDPETLWGLVQELGLGLGFFLREIPVTSLVAAHDDAQLDEDQWRTVTARTRIWLETCFDLESFFDVEEIPLFVAPDGFPQSGESPRDAALAAEALRDAWGLVALPVPDLTDLLDNVGIKIASIDGVEGFDAVGFRSDDELSLPVIAVRRDLPGDAQRYAVARELAYFVLDGVTSQTAGHFAASFLVPAQALQQELGNQRKNIELYELQLLKQKYGISMRKALVRAASIRIIDRDTLGEWTATFLENGWNTSEPGDDYPSEIPARLYRLAMRLQAEGEVEPENMADLLGLAPEVWDDIVNFRVENLNTQ
jgi:transcriptional regulator with XRE-family HTH domain